MSIRKDDIGFGGYFLYQDTDGFSYGIDAVLLADFASCRSSDRVIDLGTGTGIIPLIIYAKYAPSQIVGIEKQRSSFELAVRNSVENDLQQSISFLHADVIDLRSAFSPECFDLVTTNPPYAEKGRGPESDNSLRHDARVETTASLEDFIAVSAYLLKSGGRLCMVHRPSRLVDILLLGRKYKLEAKKIRMVLPRKGEAANIVLVELVKNGGKELKVLPELVVREGDRYSVEIEKIYGRL